MMMLSGIAFGNPNVKLKESEKMKEKVDEKKEEIKEFSEVWEGGGVTLEGEQLEIADVLDKKIIIRNFRLLPSNIHEGNFAVVQGELDDELITFPTGSKVIMAQLEKLKEKLPIRGTITKPKGKRYYTLT
jgi:hypothetical protein